MSIVVDKNVPIPKDPPRVARGRYRWPDMVVGDSFLVPSCEAPHMRVAASAYKRRCPGWDYLTQTVEGGVRLWRTA